MASHCRKLVSACNVSKYRHYKPAFTEYADKFELLALQMFESLAKTLADGTLGARPSEL